MLASQRITGSGQDKQKLTPRRKAWHKHPPVSWQMIPEGSCGSRQWPWGINFSQLVLTNLSTRNREP